MMSRMKVDETSDSLKFVFKTNVDLKIQEVK